MIRLLFSSLIFLAALWGYQFLYRFGAAGFILPADEIGWLKHLRGILLILAGSIGIPVVAEWISFALSKWLGSDPTKVRSFSMAWVRGVALYLVVAFLSVWLLIYAGRTEKPFAPLAAAAGVMAALLALRRPFQWMVTGGLVRKISNAPGRFIRLHDGDGVEPHGVLARRSARAGVLLFGRGHCAGRFRIRDPRRRRLHPLSTA